MLPAVMDLHVGNQGGANGLGMLGSPGRRLLSGPRPRAKHILQRPSVQALQAASLAVVCAGIMGVKLMHPCWSFCHGGGPGRLRRVHR